MWLIDWIQHYIYLKLTPKRVFYASILLYMYDSVSLATFAFLMLSSLNKTVGCNIGMPCSWTEGIFIHFLRFPRKINLLPLSLATICVRAQHVIPVVKPENEVNGNTPYCMCFHIWSLMCMFFDVGKTVFVDTVCSCYIWFNTKEIQELLEKERTTGFEDIWCKTALNLAMNEQIRGNSLHFWEGFLYLIQNMLGRRCVYSFQCEWKVSKLYHLLLLHHT